MRPTVPPLEDRFASSERKATRFVVRLLLLLGGALLLVGGCNYLVDPYSLYGSPLELPRIRPVRLVKLDLLRKADPPPEALVLGSSRVRVLAPVGVEYLFGLRAFQLGGLKSSPQNWLSVTRYAVDDLGYPIRLVILGVDPSSFVDTTNYLQHPATVPELRRNLRHPLLAWVRSMVNLWSPRQVKASIGVLLSASRTDRRVDTSGYDWGSDGFVRTFHALDPVDITETAIELHRSMGVVEREHLDDFEAFLDFAAERGIRVIAYVTPEAPALVQALEQTHFSETRATTHEILQEASGRERVVFCEVDSLGLQKPDFVDPHHPTLDAGTRILGRLYRCAREGEAD